MPIEFTGTTITICILLGLTAGIFSAMFGVGSGIIVVPFLTLVMLLPQKDAQGVALCIMVPMSLVGAIRYHINPEIHIDWKLVALLGVMVIIGANIGATIAAKASNKALQIGFSILLVVIGFRILWTSIRG